jgi:predicted nucleic acid-binding protein
VRRVDRLLAEGRVALIGPVYAELLSGTKTRASFDELRELLQGLDWLDEPDDVWDQVVQARFTLARQGEQVAIVDLIIALTAAAAGYSIVTRDGDFKRIARVVSFEIVVF